MTHAWQRFPVWYAALYPSHIRFANGGSDFRRLVSIPYKFALRDPKRSAELVPPEPPRRRREQAGVGGRASMGLRGGISPSPLPVRGAPFPLLFVEM